MTVTLSGPCILFVKSAKGSCRPVLLHPHWMTFFVARFRFFFLSVLPEGISSVVGVRSTLVSGFSEVGVEVSTLVSPGSPGVGMEVSTLASGSLGWEWKSALWHQAHWDGSGSQHSGIRLIGMGVEVSTLASGSLGWEWKSAHWHQAHWDGNGSQHSGIRLIGMGVGVGSTLASGSPGVGG